MREKKKPKKRILCAIISCSLLASIGFAQPASAADTAVDTPAVQDDIETMSYSDGTSTGTSELTGVSLGTGTTVYAEQFINQVDVYNSALKMASRRAQRQTSNFRRLQLADQANRLLFSIGLPEETWNLRKRISNAKMV